MAQSKVKYLIIGNSAGGIGAAEAIRAVDNKSTITIVSDEPYPVYSRPQISEYLATGHPLEKMLFRPADFYDRNNITTILGKKVARLDVGKHTIELENGEHLAWGKLLLATGGLPIVPRMEGSQRKGVFTFTTLDDAKAIDQFLKQYPQEKLKAVVIGGGLIGVSVTEALVKRGVAVTIIEMRERILNVLLDEAASALAHETLRQIGVEIITGHTVSKINGSSDSKPTGVTLDDGQVLPCALVIVAIGVLPRTELAAGAGIKVNRGIVVDRHMATSSPDVYACGDVAESYDFVYGENRLAPIWPNAYLGGRIAGLNMAGVPTEYQGGTAMNSMKYFGLSIVSAGMVNPPDDSYEVLSHHHKGSYHKVIVKDGIVVGMVFAGNIEQSGIVLSLMRDKVNVADFKQVLVAEDFGFIALPEKIWRPRLEVPPSATVIASAAVEPAEKEVAGD